MARWLAKAAIQGILSRLPRGEILNYFLQQYVTKRLVTTDDFFIKKLRQCHQHIENYFKFSKRRNERFTCLELGTGWSPIIPIGLYLCGAGIVYTIDKKGLLKGQKIKETVNQFLVHIANNKLLNELPRVNYERIDKLIKITSKNTTEPLGLLADLNIRRIVGDARDIDLPKGTINLFTSNNVLEHISMSVQKDIFAEFHRIGKTDALMSHYVDMSDHYSQFDKSLSPYNFLKYSDRVWRLFNNDLQYQNRLRLTDYIDLHDKTKWKIIETKIQSGNIGDLDRLKLSERFLKYSKDDLIVLNSWLISVMI
jgi:hypothetical protein